MLHELRCAVLFIARKHSNININILKKYMYQKDPKKEIDFLINFTKHPELFHLKNKYK